VRGESGLLGNICRTTPLIKPKDRRVLSLRARARFLAPRYRCGTRVGQLPKSFTTLPPPPPPVKRARKFAPVSLHSRGPPFSLAARNATRSSARIATALETRRPPLSLSLSLSFYLGVSPFLLLSCVLVPRSLTSAYSIAPLCSGFSNSASLRVIN